MFPNLRSKTTLSFTIQDPYTIVWANKDPFASIFGRYFEGSRITVIHCEPQTQRTGNPHPQINLATNLRISSSQSTTKSFQFKNTAPVGVH
jgi:hypothetical protein